MERFTWLVVSVKKNIELFVLLVDKRCIGPMREDSKKDNMMSTIIFITVCVVSFSTFGFIGLGVALIVMGAL